MFVYIYISLMFQLVITVNITLIFLKKEDMFMVFDLICVTKDLPRGLDFCLTDCGPADGCNPDDVFDTDDVFNTNN